MFRKKGMTKKIKGKFVPLPAYRGKTLTLKARKLRRLLVGTLTKNL